MTRQVLSLADWTQEQAKHVGPHSLKLLTVSDEHIAMGRDKSASVIPLHYVSEQRLSLAFEMLDKPGVAKLLREKLPRTPRIRSGDLGEILAAEYISERTRYAVPVKRLRWKDQRETPMHGDDVIGIDDTNNNGPLRFLKTEAKSRASLSNHVITLARKSLDRDDGLPSPHSLSFIADRLLEQGKDKLANAIIRAQLVTGVRQNHVEHLIFTFSGNAPEHYLSTSLTGYKATVSQMAVGLQIEDHQSFISSVFNKAVCGHHEP